MKKETVHFESARTVEEFVKLFIRPGEYMGYNGWTVKVLKVDAPQGNIVVRYLYPWEWLAYTAKNMWLDFLDLFKPRQ